MSDLDGLPYSGISNPNVSTGNSWDDIFKAQARLNTAATANRAMNAPKGNTNPVVVTGANPNMGTFTGAPITPGVSMSPAQAHARNMATSSGVYAGPGQVSPRQQFLDSLDLSIPTLGPAANLDVPEFSMPEIDQSRIDFLSGKAGAGEKFAMKGALREGIAATKRIDNPNVAKMQNRALLRGYGEGLGRVMDNARRAGLAEYMSTEFNPAVQQAQTNYQGDVSEATARYNQANQDRISKYNTEMSRYNSNRAMQARSYGLA